MKKYIALLIFILALFCSCRNNNSESDFPFNENELLSEQNITDEYLSKTFVKGYNQNQVIWQSDTEDLNGDGQNEKIRVVVTDENYFKKSGEKGLFYGKVMINGSSKDLYFNWSQHSHSSATFQIVDIDKNDSLKEFLVSQSEPEDEDPSKLHSIFRYFGKNLLTQTQIRSEGYSGGNITFFEKKIEVRHKNNPETIGTYNLSKFFIKQTKLFIGRESEMVAACPYVYLKAGGDYVFKGEIIRNLIGKAAESMQTLEIGIADSEKIIIRIKEEKEEISFVNQIAVKSNGKIINPRIIESNREIIFDDNKYYLLHKGEYIDLEFVVSKNSKITLVGKGYYIPISKN